jgi:hypothetical protein
LSGNTSGVSMGAMPLRYRTYTHAAMWLIMMRCVSGWSTRSIPSSASGYTDMQSMEEARDDATPDECRGGHLPATMRAGC